MLSRFSSLRFLAAGVSKLAASRNTIPPVFNRLYQGTITFSDEVEEESTRIAPRVAVVLCGCKTIDGTDPLEAACLMIELARQKIKADYFAPSSRMHYAWRFGQRRAVMEIRDPRFRPIAREEAARLVPRNFVHELRDLQPEYYDALVIPGGIGVLSVLSNFLTEFENGSVDWVMQSKIQAFREARKPIATISYAGLLLAGTARSHFTMGRQSSDGPFNYLLSRMIRVADSFGMKHYGIMPTVCAERYGIISTPGYTDRLVRRRDVFTGIRELVSYTKSLIRPDAR